MHSAGDDLPGRPLTPSQVPAGPRGGEHRGQRLLLPVPGWPLARAQKEEPRRGEASPSERHWFPGTVAAIADAPAPTTSELGGAGTARSHGKKQPLSRTARTPRRRPTVTNKQDNGLEARGTQPLSQEPPLRAVSVPSGGLGTGRREPGGDQGRIWTLRQSRSLRDTAGARGWLGSWMTHPQRSPGTLAGSFAKQVFSLAVSELGAGSAPAPEELLGGLLLTRPGTGLRGPSSITLCHGQDAPPCLSPAVMHRGQSWGSDGSGSDVGYLTAIALEQKTGQLPQSLSMKEGALIKCSALRADPAQHTGSGRERMPQPFQPRR